MASYDTPDARSATQRTAPQSTTAPGGASHLGRLNDLDDFKVADGYPDIRGWAVRTGDGHKIGEVGDLVVDTQQMRVRYLDVALDRSLRELARDATIPGDQDGHTLIPIGSVQLDDDQDDVVVNGYSLEQVAGLPRYGGRSISGDYERSLVDRHRGRAAEPTRADVAAPQQHDYDHEDYDDQRPFAARRQRASGTGGAGSEQRMALAEEQLDVGKRQTSAGQVELRKTVETEHVQEQVQLRHDEVTIERRTVTDPTNVSSTPQITDDEVRIPLMEERLIVQKVLVPREEIIVRRNSVMRNETVEADLRRERLDVDDTAARGLVRGSSAADAVDDVKDRVDGNPASRPGPDATDRRP